MNRLHPLGKLRPELLAEMLRKYSSADERVLVGPAIGEDATVIDFGPTYLVAKTDPITFATDQIGWYALQVNANDLAVMGARPRWFLATLLLPEGATTDRLVEDIFAQLSQACRSLGVSLCGGHTEIAYGLGRPILVGLMLGEVERERLVRSSGAQVGDDLLLTKGIPIEATAIIAREKEEELRGRFPDDFIERCKSFLQDPGLSVLQEAQVATSCTHVHAMHDPTEGGLATGLWELAQASGVGLRVRWESIPILAESAVLCREFGLEPLGAIASGALLVALAPEDTARVISALEDAGIRAAVIGQAQERAQGLKMEKAGELMDLPCFARDEIARLFEG